ncbi:hypothetical protein ACO2Q9_02475 [Variovorax sp. VNK109]|jgi:hypothetical protein|uniref:hypothetical protein n=1 Tax=Variovorax sp. VNK109 TaxID=3400919 RepID=UPI003C0434EF
MQVAAQVHVPARSPIRQVARLTGVWWLALALVVAPWLGQVHGALHAKHAPRAVQAVAGQHSHPAHGLEALFGDHGQTSECRLYDQLGHGDLLPCVPAVALPVVPPAFVLAFLQGEAVARFAALFEARGPPVLR